MQEILAYFKNSSLEFQLTEQQPKMNLQIQMENIE